MKEKKYSFKKIIILTIIIFLWFLPLMIDDPYVIHLSILALIFGIFAMSWDLLYGYIGLFNFGHTASFGIAAYTSALLTMRLGIPLYLGIPIGGIVAMAVSMPVGIPCLRLRGLYFSIVMTAYNGILSIIFSNLIEITRGELGLWGIPPIIILSLSRPISCYYASLGICLISLVALIKISKSPMGLAFLSIREDERAAMSVGVDVFKYKMIAFLLSSFFAGLAGTLYAHYTLILVPSRVYSWSLVAAAMAMTFFGGPATLYAPIVGSFALTFLTEFLRIVEQFRLFLYGGIIIISMLFLPEGILKKIEAALRFL